jgi:hypothetical protein
MVPRQISKCSRRLPHVTVKIVGGKQWIGAVRRRKRPKGAADRSRHEPMTDELCRADELQLLYRDGTRSTRPATSECHRRRLHARMCVIRVVHVTSARGFGYRPVGTRHVWPRRAVRAAVAGEVGAQPTGTGSDEGCVRLVTIFSACLRVDMRACIPFLSHH